MVKYYRTADRIDIILEYRKKEYEDCSVRLIDWDTGITLASGLTYGDHSSVKTVVNELHQLATTLVAVADDLEEAAKEEE